MVAFNGVIGGITGGVGSAFSGAGIATQVAVGAGIGAGGSVAQQEVFTGHVDWSQVGISAGVGGAAGGAGALLGKLAAAREVNAGAVNTPKPVTVVETETFGKAVKPTEATQAWEDFLGEGPYTNVHPRLGTPDPNRIVNRFRRRRYLDDQGGRLYHHA